ncbi:MAG: DUF2799 domain-containing protein [Pseudomonadota bacterium]
MMRVSIPLLRAAALCGALAACEVGGPSPRSPLSPSADAGSALCAPERRGAWGRVDAEVGYGPDQGLAALAACPGLSAADLEAAEDAFLAGHALGRAAYCAPDNARALGQQGAAVTLDCPPQMQAAFDAAYLDGRAEPRPGPWKPAIRPIVTIGVGSSGTNVDGGIGIAF